LRDAFEITCPYSKKSYNFTSPNAAQWVEMLRKVLADKMEDDEQPDESFLR